MVNYGLCLLAIEEYFVARVVPNFYDKSGPVREVLAFGKYHFIVLVG